MLQTLAPSGERIAHAMLAAVSDPYDFVTRELIDEVGAEETLRLLADATSPTPGAVNPDAVVRWRSVLTPRLENVSAEGLAASTAEFGLRVIMPGDADWPKALDDLGRATPYALWAKGDTALLTGPLNSRVTVDGARAATSYGVDVADQLSSSLAEQGHVLVSGGAYGIDSVVHGVALRADSGSTIAIMPGGLDRYYPVGNELLLRRIEEQGLLLSEYPPGVGPTRQRFAHRTRLLAAVSAFTVIAEAGVRSGSLRVANCAYELGRGVGAVPGMVTSAASAGCNRLLRDDTAEVITSATDVTAVTLPPPSSWALGRAYQDVARTLDAPASSPSQRGF